MTGIWINLSGDASFIVIPLSIAAFVAFANVMLRSRLSGGQRLVLYGTIAAAGATALFIDLAELTDGGQYGDPFGFQRFAAGTAIVAVSGTMAVIVLAMLNRRTDRRTAYALRAADSADRPAGSGDALRNITLRCPRCQREQTLPLGETSCGECRLVIHTHVEAPACPKCGYDVSMIKGDKCPECGAGLEGMV
jgi:predicted Zn-ribbon and HTH transcriptional regulator